MSGRTGPVVGVRRVILRADPLVLAGVGLALAMAGAAALPEFWSRAWTQALTFAIVMIGVFPRDETGRGADRGADSAKFLFYLAVYAILMTFATSWAAQ